MINKTQPTSNSKANETSLDEYMERLGRVSGETKTAGILRWLGVSSSSYSNWVRRGTIPYKTIVNALLERNISLNWFFAPYQRLEVPALRDEAVQEGARTYLQQTQANMRESQRVIQAYSHCQALLQSHGASCNDDNMKLMLDLYFKVGTRVATQEQVIDYLAKSLAEREQE